MNDRTITVNETVLALDCEDRESLADFIRSHGVTSVHTGCEHGVCGSCTVNVDGVSVRSCLTLARSHAGSVVTTLDGLQDELANRLRTAFNQHHALQCGFCTPGVFVSAYELLSTHQEIDETTARRYMAGNICRCTGYQGIIDAILSVHSAMSGHTSKTDPNSIGES